MNNDEKRKIAEAAREVAKEALNGKRFGTGSPFCKEGDPNCAMGLVLFLMGYRGKKNHSTIAIDSSGNEVNAYDVFHNAIDDSDQMNKPLVARIWRSNDRHDNEFLAEALNAYAKEVEKHIQ